MLACSLTLRNSLLGSEESFVTLISSKATQKALILYRFIRNDERRVNYCDTHFSGNTSRGGREEPVSQSVYDGTNKICFCQSAIKTAIFYTFLSKVVVICIWNKTFV